MASIQEIFEKYIPDEDRDIILSTLDYRDSGQDYDRIQIMKNSLFYNFYFGKELIEYMSINDRSHTVRMYAKNLLSEISAIELGKSFSPESFELIDKTIYQSIKKFLEKKNISEIPSYIEKPTKLTTVQQKADSEAILKTKSVQIPEPVVKRETITPPLNEDNLIEKIATCETEILEFLLGNTIGVKSILGLLEAVEKKETQLSQIFKNPEYHGVDESLRTNHLGDIINSIKEVHEQNEQLRGTLFDTSIKDEDKKEIRRNIARQSRKLSFSLRDWHLREDILGAIENAIKHEIDWYKKATLKGDAIREREVALKIEFRALIRDMVKIQRRRIAIKQAKEELIGLTLPLVSRIAKDYLSKGLEEDDLLGEGRVGLVEALNKFEFRKGYKFSDFSTWWVRQSIIMAIVHHNKMMMHVPQNIIEEIIELNAVAKSLVYKLGREPTANEIADEMEIDANKVESILINAIKPIEAETLTAESDLAADFDLGTVKEMLKMVHITKKPKAKSKREDVSAGGIKRRSRPSIKKVSEKELKEKAEFSIERQLEKTISERKVKTRPVLLQVDMPIDQISSPTHTRNPYVSELAKRRAKGYCQLCKNPAPFNDRHGIPYLETHHVVWLSRGGEDTIENTVALCPNCHRKLHILALQSDIDNLLQKAQKEFSC